MNPPPRIGLIAQGGAGWMGGSEYIRNLLRAIPAAGGSVPTLFCPGDPTSWGDSGVPIARVRSVWRLPFVDRLGINEALFARALRKHPVEFLYPLSYSNDRLTFPLRRALGATSWAAWIPDFQHRHLPQFFTPEQIAQRDHGIGRLLDEATVVVMSSASAAEDLRRFHPGYSGRVEVFRFATFPQPGWYDPHPEAELAEVPSRFLLVCNQFWVHKNHLTIFRALALLAQRGVRPVVLCTGALSEIRNPAYPRTVRAFLRDAGLETQVHLLGLLPRRSQIELLRRSVALIQPSLFEGWSTVVEDARIFGKPVLLSDIAVHREQAPPRGEYFPAESAEALAELIEAAWRDWPAGIDLGAEHGARIAAEARFAEVGRRFLEIAALA